MYRVMFVDDDMIVRTTLHTIVDWEKYGFEIAGDAKNGQQALEKLKSTPVDLLITDMKMPIMDGITLIKQVNQMEQVPVILALSGYDDFLLVREAFRLGALDYLLKSDINEIMLSSHLERIVNEIQKVKGSSPAGRTAVKPAGESQILQDMALGRTELKESFFEDYYYIVRFEIVDFKQQVFRFGNDLEDALIKPMLEIANQIPMVASKCTICSLSPSSYLLYYRAKDADENRKNRVQSVSRQILNNWKNYMNLPAIAGISQIGSGASRFLECMETAGFLLTFQSVFEKTDVFTMDIQQKVDIREAVLAGIRYQDLKDSLKSLDNAAFEQSCQRIFTDFYKIGFEQAKIESIYMIYQVSMSLRENNDDILKVFPQEVDYYEKVQRITSLKEMEIWMTNYLRWIMDYLEHNYDRRQNDVIQKAKRFIWDNYANPELSLGNVADFVGLNEKYFSTRFTKETGTTFSSYLMEFRISKAKELIRKTDMKIYEISQSVGYNSVEHFNRIFKKLCQMSPVNYKKEGKK